MSNKKPDPKKKKAAQLMIRVDRTERDTFVALCDALDTSAAREIRRFIREWVTANQPNVSDESTTIPSADDKTKPKGEDPTTVEVAKPRTTRKPKIVPA